jgi:predicted nucleotidyltransferase
MADKESDFDLIVIKETDEPFVRRAVSFPDLPFRADVFVYTPEEFARMREEGSLFLENALNGSRVIYEKQQARSRSLV